MEFEVAFEEKFGGGLLESINEEHRLLIVASELDNSTEKSLIICLPIMASL